MNIHFTAPSAQTETLGFVVPAWTPEQRFMFDLEGRLYVMGALAETLETLLVAEAETLRRASPTRAAAMDYAATNLADAIKELSERYDAVRFPDSSEPLAA